MKTIYMLADGTWVQDWDIEPYEDLLDYLTEQWDTAGWVEMDCE